MLAGTAESSHQEDSKRKTGNNKSYDTSKPNLVTRLSNDATPLNLSETVLPRGIQQTL